VLVKVMSMIALVLRRPGRGAGLRHRPDQLVASGALHEPLASPSGYCRRRLHLQRHLHHELRPAVLEELRHALRVRLLLDVAGRSAAG
jgi:hypothetical protein